MSFPSLVADAILQNVHQGEGNIAIVVKTIHSGTYLIFQLTERAQAVLKISQSWLTEGDSVTLGCAVRSSSRGWTFSWFRYDHELLSDSSRGAEGSYTLSPAAVKHTGVYSCRAERGAYFTEYSYTELRWVTCEYSCPWSSSSIVDQFRAVFVYLLLALLYITCLKWNKTSTSV